MPELVLYKCTWKPRTLHNGVLEGLILLVCIIMVTFHLRLPSKIHKGANHSKYFQYLMLVLGEEHVYYTYAYRYLYVYIHVQL